MSPDFGNVSLQFGSVDKKAFSPAGSQGASQTWSISFDSSFSEKPAVFITVNGDSPNAAAVAIAEDITKSGFKLVARNSEGKAGSAGFAWLAIGKQIG
jgi:hypothetical protein